MICANIPETIDYTAYRIENSLVIDNTGAFRDDEALSLHLQSKGVAKVLLTAPGKGRSGGAIQVKTMFCAAAFKSVPYLSKILQFIN